MKYALCYAALILSVGIADEQEDEVKRIQGTWIQEAIVTAEGRFLVAVKGGGQISTTFEGAKFTEFSGKEAAGHGTFTLDCKKQPNEINLTYAPDDRISRLPGEAAQPTTMRCLYKIESDQMKICYSLKQRPKEFTARDDDFIIEFKRKK